MKDRQYWKIRMELAEKLNEVIELTKKLENDDSDICFDCPCQNVIAIDRDGHDITNPVCYHSCPMMWQKADAERFRKEMEKV